MCGRYNLRTSRSQLVDLFGIHVPEDMDLEPRYNIAPTQNSAFVTLESTGLECRTGRWGLVPRFVKNIGKMGQPLINARSETIDEKPSFRSAFQHRRCLVPASGFYEWRREGKAKTPFHIHRVDDAPFCMAGLWERWERDDQVIDSFTILTTEANPLMASIHNRMPVMLRADEFPVWLDNDIPHPALESLLAPREWEGWEIVPANPLVNSWKNEVPACLQPPEQG